MPGNEPPHCVWPQLPAPFDDALKEATRFIIEEADPVGIVATGTIVRGEAHARSDLDLQVVHDAEFRRRVQRFFQGVPTEIFINPPHVIRNYFADEHRVGRPVTAHMLATGFTVYSIGTVVEELREEAKDWLRRPSVMSDSETIRGRYAAATRLEDGADIAEADEVSSAMLLSQAVASMLEFFCRSRTGRVPRSKELLGVASAHDARVGRLAAAFFRTGSAVERVRIAEALADLTIETRGFFPWDSGPEPVAPPTA